MILNAVFKSLFLDNHFNVIIPDSLRIIHKVQFLFIQTLVINNPSIQNGISRLRSKWREI